MDSNSNGKTVGIMHYDTDNDSIMVTGRSHGKSYTIPTHNWFMSKQDHDSPGDMSLDDLKAWRIPIQKEIVDVWRKYHDISESGAYIYLAMVDSMYQNVDPDDCKSFKSSYSGSISRKYIDLNDTPIDMDDVMDSAEVSHNLPIDSITRRFIQDCHNSMVIDHSVDRADPSDSYLVVWVN